jgi:hypothetical protein
MGHEIDASETPAAISVAGICERDIDLLLLEEFHSSQSFQSWFLSRVIGKTVIHQRFLAASYSVRQTLGESDLEAWFRDEDQGQICVLVENKINADPQPEQANRYKKRALAYLTRHQASSAYTAIVAPRIYLDGRSARGFDADLSYEDLREWFSAAESLGTRRQYKIALLTLAMEKGRIGYLSVEDRAVSEFWYQYWTCANESAPELQMDRPSPKLAGSGFVYFRPQGLPAGVKLVHKLADGFIDVQFAGMGDRIIDLHRLYDTCMPAAARIERAYKSAVIRVDVPRLNANLVFQEQSEAVSACLVSARRLLSWFLSMAQNRNKL